MRESTNSYLHQILVGELARRRGKNPRYSLRAMARAVGLSSGFLSQLINGRRRMSLGRGVELVVALGLGERQTSAIIEQLIALQIANDAGQEK